MTDWLPHFMTALGGVGLFLLGMALMTEGLRELAGDSLRRWLERFTNSPWTGALTGAGVTAVVQSSSATVVAAVGFVSAGLLTFPQALGVCFGANIGTTATGWLVAIGGFKLDLGQIALPLVLIGALLRLLGRGRTRAVGSAVAGFGLVFLGIETMKVGLAAFEGAVTPQSFPEDTYGGRAQLVVIGAVLTLVTQSSSAGVAMALAALHAGMLGFGQAAALVIGMDVGTSVTSLIASFGGGTATRRTGLSHVVYNVLTALGAFFLLDAYVWALESARPGVLLADAQLSLVGFHSLFNALGVLAVLPFAGRFAALIEHLVPERLRLTARLDPKLLQDVPSAVSVSARTARELAGRVLRHVATSLREPERAQPLPRELRESSEALRDYLGRFGTEQAGDAARGRQLAVLHTTDHLSRLGRRLDQVARIQTTAVDHQLEELASSFATRVESLAAALEYDAPLPLGDLDAERSRLRETRRSFRSETLERAAAHRLTTQEALRRLDAARWLVRVAYHAWRIAVHLQNEAQLRGLPSAAEVQAVISSETEDREEPEDDGALE